MIIKSQLKIGNEKKHILHIFSFYIHLKIYKKKNSWQEKNTNY